MSTGVVTNALGSARLALVRCRVEWTAIRALSGAQLDELDAMARRAAVIDGVPPKVYWPLISRSDPGVLHLLGHEDGALVAAASSFCFQQDELEFTCVVDPDRREQGRGVEALSRLVAVRVQRAPGVTARLRVPTPLARASARVRQADATPVEAEHTMVAHARSVFALDVPNRQLTLQDATADDAGLLAVLDATSFETEPADTRPRFQAHLADENRRVWIAKRDGIPVGKLHARRDPDGVWIHDLCTDPDVRGLGLGREMVLRCARRILDGELGRAETSIWLEVQTNNAAAIATYTRCAFETVRTDTMLELPLRAFMSALASTP